MDSGYIEYVNDNEVDDNEDNAEDNEDESEFNKFEYYDCSTRNQDEQHILIRGYKLIDNICCSIGSGAIVVPVEEEEKEEEKGNEEAHSVVVAVTEVTSIESELNEVLLVPPPTLVELTTVDEIATPLVEDADIAVAAVAVALNDAGGNDNNGAWFQQFSAGYEDLCCCVGSTTSSTPSVTSRATSITKNTSKNYVNNTDNVNNDGNGNINNNNNINNNHEGLILYTEEETPTTMTQPHSKELDDKEKEEQEQEQEDNEGSKLILDDPRYNCNTTVPVSSESSASSSCGAQMKKSFRSTKTPLNSSKTKNSNMNSRNDDDNDDHGDYIEQQTVCTNRDTVVTNATNKSTKSIMTTTTNKKSSSTATRVKKLKEHLRDMVKVRALAFPLKKTFSSSSSFGNKSNNNNSTHVPSALAPAPELLSPTEGFAFKPKKSNKQMKKKDKNAVLLSTSSTKKMTNRASSKSFGRRKTSNAAVNKRRPVLLSVTIEEEGHTTENIIVAPLFTKAAGANENENENENDDDEESKDILSAIPKLIVPKERKNKHSGVTDDKTSVSVLSGITESNKSIHTILRKEVNNDDDQRDDADTSLFSEKSSSKISNPYPVGGSSGLGSGSGLGNSTFDSGVDDDASSQSYSLGSSNNDDESIGQTEYRNKSRDYYGHHSIPDADYLKDIYTVKPMHSGKQVKAGQLTL
ncbi:hypothetical protein FRACYDRAFT_246391 [Fragilariopsis cylindrus CCMP1102]|uniref:Uncharacterized protein n=1 Tax=Fragilariopsis cylindrus CCMP1102 TaxID=635003 RepID=A0A1E7EZ35_9STRA|nr:hypothetical protein FRACYDRAFT_246391 [Fragilariopsis cylindrus CCMP1102]|eukprot:OEU11278.1 hypothetical protein FRACYDRAFT_246391 [Fragilariopsis cylindrus CCMP1102]